MSVKIQINSLDALNRLIGNDSELEVEVRNSVVQEFTRRHLKAVAQVQLEKLEAEAYKTCERLVQEKLGFRSFYGFNLSKELQQKITQNIEDKFDEILARVIQQKVNDCIESDHLKNAVQSLIDRKLDLSIRDVVNREVQAKLKEASKVLTNQ